MSKNQEILDRIELLEERYLITRERLSKLERVQYQIRDQIGFIQFLSKDPSSQKPIEDRLTEIYGALGEILNQLDSIKASTPPASASQYVPPVQTAQPAIPAHPMHQTHASGMTKQQPSVVAMHKVPPLNPQPAIPEHQQAPVHPPINYKPRQAPQGFINR